MRKFFFSLLILAVFASTMVCGCPHDALASTHSHHHSDGDHHHGNDTTAAQDCSGTDMQLPLQISVNAPDLKHSFHFDYILAEKAPLPVLASAGGIRGPPPDWPDFHQTQPSVLLSTQRLLI